MPEDRGEGGQCGITHTRKVHILEVLMDTGGILALLTSCLEGAEHLHRINAVAVCQGSVTARDGLREFGMVSEVLEAD